MTAFLVVVLIVVVVWQWNWLVMAGSFAVKELSGERRELSYLKAKLAVLKAIARAIGTTEVRLRDAEKR